MASLSLTRRRAITHTGNIVQGMRDMLHEQCEKRKAEKHPRISEGEQAQNSVRLTATNCRVFVVRFLPYESRHIEIASKPRRRLGQRQFLRQSRCMRRRCC